jgi:hypothetical protein
MTTAKSPLHTLRKLCARLLDDSSDSFASLSAGTSGNLRFYLSHIHELFVLALENTGATESGAAYRALTTTNPQVSAAIVRDDAFCSFVAKIVASGDISEVVISRIAGIGFRVLSRTDRPSISSYGYIISLVKYLHYYDVADMFRHMLVPSPAYADSQRELVNLELPGLLAAVAGQLIDQSPRDSADTVNALVGVFNILAAAFSNSHIAREFAVADVITLLLREVRGPHRVCDAHWAAILSFSKLSSPASPLFLDGAIAILREKRTEVYSCCTTAVHYLALHPCFETVEVCGNLLRLVIQFPSHSFLWQAVGSFFSACLQNPVTVTIAAAMFGPILMAIAERPEQGCAHAFAMEMAGWLAAPEHAHPDEAIPGMKAFIRRVYVPWHALATAQYGGKIERSFLVQMFTKEVYPE